MVESSGVWAFVLPAEMLAPVSLSSSLLISVPFIYSLTSSAVILYIFFNLCKIWTISTEKKTMPEYSI